MNKRYYIYLYIPLSLFLLSGCWDIKQADEITYVSAIGLDEAKDGKIKITYLIVNPEFGTQPSSPSDTQPFNYVSFLADDFFIAKNIMNTMVSKRMSYVILNQLFVSEKLAKKDKFIRFIYDATKDPEIRRDMNLVVTKEKAEDFIKKFKPKLEQKPFKYFSEKTDIINTTGLVPFHTEIFYYFRVTEADNDLFMTTYATHGSDSHTSKEDETYTMNDIHLTGNIDETQYLGSAIFKRGKMVGTMSGRETMLASMLQVSYPRRDYYLRTFRDPFDEDYTITTRLNIAKRSKVKMNLKKSTPSIHVTLPITVDVLTNHSMVDYSNNSNDRQKLKNHIKEKLKEEYEVLIKKTQEEFGSDPFGWSIFARRHFLTTDEFEAFNWMEKYPMMDITIDLHITLRDFGRQSEVIDKHKLKE